MTENDLLPYAGRDEALARIHTQRANAPHEPLVVIGRKHIGKTAFLRQVMHTIPQHTIAVLIPLGDISPDDEAHLWVMTSQYILDELNQHGMILPDLPARDVARTWFMMHFMPMVMKTLRGRELLLLWDDAHHLLNTNLPDDLFETLHGLCSSSVQMIFAFDIRHEDHLSQFMPFITPKHLLRLGNLSHAGCLAILADHQGGVGEDMIRAIYDGSGGLPYIIQQYGYELGAHGDIKAMNNAVYARVSDEFLRIWDERTADEKLVLTAIADLFYDDPLRPITTAHIATWSVNSDYLLDETAINAALRGLLYDELVILDNHHVRVQGDLFRKWLLENARIGGKPTDKRQAVPIGIIIITVIIVAVMVLVILSVFGGATDGGVNIPTITPLS